MERHQFVDRASGALVDERLFGRRIVSFLYSRVREQAPWLFRAATSRRSSDLLATLCFDLPLADRLVGSRRFLERYGVDLAECLAPPASFTTSRRIFERQIRFEACRPLPAEPRAVVSPSDARLALGSLAASSDLFLKGKLFAFDELLGRDKPRWLAAFAGGLAAVFRLTPEKYHYNHLPASGVVEEVYEIGGGYHSCNPGATVELVTPLSKNRRTVTVIDTDVEGGTGVGRIAMIEVVALMIGQVVQCYSAQGYGEPRPLSPGTFVERGAVKSLFRPGSSTVVLLFEPGRIEPAADLVANLRRPEAQSALASSFGQPLVETEVTVRSLVAWPRPLPWLSGETTPRWTEPLK